MRQESGLRIRTASPEILPVSDPNTIEFAAELTIAWLSNPTTRASADDVDAFLKAMSDTVSGLTSSNTEEVQADLPEYTPAVSVRKSLGSRDHIISMIDGRPYRTLKRHLATNGLTPDEYRARYNLKSDYPMVAPAYSESRRETAKRLGLGRKPAEAAPAASESAPAPAEPASHAEQPAAPERKTRARKSAADPQATASEPVPTSSDAAPEQSEQAVAPTRKPRARKSAAEAKEAAKKHLGG